METTVKQTAFIVACKEAFGFKEGQSLADFQAEVKQLTPADRAELAPLLSKHLNKPVSV